MTKQHLLFWITAFHCISQGKLKLQIVRLHGKVTKEFIAGNGRALFTYCTQEHHGGNFLSPNSVILSKHLTKMATLNIIKDGPSKPQL